MKLTQDIAWWYWLFTVSGLGAGLFGWYWGLMLAIVLCLIQIGHVFWITRNVAVFAMQVRLVYLTMLIAGLCGPLKWLHWVQFIGTTARVVFGYCFFGAHLIACSLESQTAALMGNHPRNLFHPGLCRPAVRSWIPSNVA